MTIADHAALLERLVAHRTIGEAPTAELEWIIAHSEFRTYEAGHVAASKDVDAPDLIVVLSGRIVVTVEHRTGTRHPMVSKAGGVTGVLPYSRMTHALADAIATERTDVLALPRNRIPDLIRECPTITARLVHVMLDRARTMTAQNWQDEKTISLGRLAAGLAHELNNPASAASRSAALLGEEVREVGEAARAVGALMATHPAATDIGAWIARVEASSGPAGSAIARADAEDALGGWLDDHGFDAGLAASLVNAGVDAVAIEDLSSRVDAPATRAIVRWMAATGSARALVGDVQRSTGRVHELVSAVRRFAFLDRSLANEPTDVSSGLADTITIWRARAEAAQVTVGLTIAEDLPVIQGNAGLLNQVWSNLLANALDAVPRGGRIDVMAAREGSSLVVRFIDNGPGIPDDVRQRMFDPFFTTRAVGEGIGLGLDIARRVVLMHEGAIEVRTEPGRTELLVTLPLPAETSAAGQSSSN